MASIPPLGQITENDHGVIVSYLSDLVRESTADRDEWVDLADDSLTIYTYGTLEWPTDKIIVNEIRNAVIAATDVQTREPPKVSLEPVETSDVGEIYALDPMIGQGMAIPPAAVAMMTAPQMTMDQATGQVVAGPAQMSADAFVEINDKLIADTYQSVFDRFWARGQLGRWVRSNLLRTNVEGWSFPLFEWDDEAESKKVGIRAVSIRQVYVDPTVEDIQDAQYAGIDLVVDADEAAKMYPDLADVIAEKASTGYPKRPIGSEDLGQASERKFERPTVTIRTFWLRNQIAAMTVDESLMSGAVVEGMVQDVVATGATGIPGEAEQFNAASATGGMAEGIGNSVEGDSGMPPAMVDAPALRPALLLADTGAEVVEGSPGWPQKRVIRQLTVLEETVVADEVCPHWDIPLLHNVCLPIPGKPWGLGEPFQLIKLQEARSRIIDAMVEHSEYFRAPLTSMPMSMFESIKQKMGQVHITPNLVLSIPDDLWIQYGGKVMDISTPPPTPPALVEMQGIIRAEMNEQSGHTEAMRGILPSAQSSGKAVELLQQGATSLIGFKSKRTGDMIERLARLMLHCMVTRLGPQDIGRIISKYPPHILDAIHRRAQQIEWDIEVTVISGTGQIQAMKKQEAREDLQLGLISRQTARERMNIDHQQEEQRMGVEAGEMMAAQAQAQAMGAQEQ